MSTYVSDRALRRPGPDRVNQAIGVILIGLIGILAGMQFVAPDKRVLSVAMAALVFGIAWRLDTVSAIGILLLALPFPRAITYGNTNFALLLLVLLIWLLRARQDPAAAPRRTEIDVPLIGLLVVYVLSFYNVQEGYHVSAFSNFLLILGCAVLLLLVINNVRSTQDLKRLHLFQVVSIGSIALLGLYEINHPGAVIVPGWFSLRGDEALEGINLHQARIGGPFHDFELFAEWTALSLLFITFLGLRAQSALSKTVYGALFLALMVLMFATVTRGAIIALAMGGLYMLVVLRRHVRFVPFTIAAVALTLLLQGVNYFVAHYTQAGDLFARLADPQSVRFTGVLPEARGELWITAFNRMMDHPIIGHGPHYVIERGIDFWYWPHNGYLYVGHIVGLAGLTFYLWLLWKFWRMSWPGRASLGDASYARGYLVCANIQMVVFMIDQLKIDYLRNPIYTFQVWLMFATIVAAYRIVQRERAAATES